MRGRYVLRGTKAVPCKSLFEWARWMEELSNRRVARDELEGVVVSTVFLGLDHSFTSEDDPLLFETMVCTDIEGWGECHRYFIWEEAMEGHKRIVEKMRAKLAASKSHGILALDAVMNKITEEGKGE